MTTHVPVLAREVVQYLNLKPGDIAIDGTLGGGGHTAMLAECVAPEGQIIGLDRDPDAVAMAERQLSGLPVQLVAANFADAPEILNQLGIPVVQGILLDLGFSSDQLADHRRGFSYDSDGPLDLRFNTSGGTPAWKLLERLSEKHLADLIYRWGEERLSRRIARAIVAQRGSQPIKTSRDLATLLRKVVPRSKHHSIDPATRTFQALRIATNDELKWVEVALRRLPDCLEDNGRIAVISFHSLEDRLVKNAFRENPRLHVETRKPVVPDEEEIQRNPRSRSARLRVATKVRSPI